MAKNRCVVCGREPPMVIPDIRIDPETGEEYPHDWAEDGVEWRRFQDGALAVVCNPCSNTEPKDRVVSAIRLLESVGGIS